LIFTYYIENKELVLETLFILPGGDLIISEENFEKGEEI
jgi:hypothetical protein